MKLILLLILALVIASGLAYQVHLEPGYALLTYGHVSIETSLAVLLFVTLIIFIGFYFSLRALLTLKRSPKSISRWNQKRKTTRSQKEINKGLINSAEGNWQRSEKLLVKHAEQSDTPLLNYLSAAHAAQSQGAYNRRDEYLFKAGKALPDQIHAIQLTRAKLQLAAGQFEQALATLQQLGTATPNHPIVLTLLMKTHLQLNEWEALYHLLPSIKNNRKIASQEWLPVEEKVLTQLFSNNLESGQLTLSMIWKALDKKQKLNPRYLIAYTSQLIRTGDNATAEELLIKGLNAQANPDLLARYMQLTIPAEKKQQQLEKWLRKHGASSEFFNALAQLCIEQEHWSKAKSYLDDSISLQPSSLAYLLLGQVQEQLGDPNNEASAHYKTGLELSIHANKLNLAPSTSQSS